MSKHTSAPWKLSEYRLVECDSNDVDQAYQVLEVKGANGETIISDEHLVMNSNDLYLMAAAPELLLALERVLHNYVDAHDQNDPEIIEAKAVIRKARGEV